MQYASKHIMWSVDSQQSEYCTWGNHQFCEGLLSS